LGNLLSKQIINISCHISSIYFFQRKKNILNFVLEIVRPIMVCGFRVGEMQKWVSQKRFLGKKLIVSDLKMFVGPVQPEIPILVLQKRFRLRRWLSFLWKDCLIINKSLKIDDRYIHEKFRNWHKRKNINSGVTFRGF
jgi:hypothetical protein